MPSVCQDLRRRYDEATTDEERAAIIAQMNAANCDTADLGPGGPTKPPPPPPGS